MTLSTEYTVSTRYVSDTAGLTSASAAQRDLTSTGREAAASQQIMERQARETGQAYEGLSRRGRKVQRQLERIEVELDSSASATHQYRRQVRSLDAALKAGLITQRRHAELLDLSAAKYKRANNRLAAFASTARGFAGAAGLTAVAAAGRGIISAGDQQEQLRIQLEVALRDRKAAADALAELKDFAGDTPARLDVLTDAFANLAVRGLRPTTEELEIFGDIAGKKGIGQFVEAVLDATQGEGERLKEFGIRMRKSGDEVTLAFADMAITVPNDAKAIKEALLEIGRVNFSGGLAAQSQTLSGKWSTLADSGSLLGAAVFEAGVGDTLKSWADGATAFLKVVPDLIPAFKELYALTPAGLASGALRDVRDDLGEGIGAVVAEGAELRSVIHDTQAAADSLDFQSMGTQLDRLRIDFIAAEGVLADLGDQVTKTAGSGSAEDFARLRTEWEKQSDLVKLYREQIAFLSGAMDRLPAAQAEVIGLTAEQEASVSKLAQSLRDQIAVLQQVQAAARGGHDDVKGLQGILTALQREEIDIEGGAARSELEALQRQVKELSDSIARIAKIRLFEKESRDEADILRALVEAAKVPGTTLEDLDLLETQLESLQQLGFPLDSTGQGAERVRSLTQDIADLRQELSGLKDGIEAVASIETIDVPAAPGTSPDFTQGDLTPAAFRGREPVVDPVQEQIAKTQAELDAMSADVSASLRDGLVSALQSAAAAGRVAFEDVFRGLQGQIGGLFERAALASVQVTGDADIDAAATDAALSQASAAAAGVSSVLSAYYAVYTIVDSWVEERRWERAHTGSVRLERLLNGDITEDLQRSGAAVIGALRQAGEGAADTIEDILHTYRGTLDRLSGIVELRVNEGQYEVAVGTYVKRFGEASQQAFDYFVVQALRHAEISGAPDEVQRTLTRSSATTVEGLERQLAVAQEIHQLPWDDTQRSIFQIEQRLRDLFRFAEEQLLAPGSFQNIGADSADVFRDLRDAITGTTLSPGQQFAQDSDTFNSQRAEIVARFEAEIAALLEQIAGLQAAMAASASAPSAGGGGLNIFDQSPGEGLGDLDITRDGGRVLSAPGDTLARLQARLAGLQAFLAALPPAIGAGEFRPTGGGRGRQRRETREEFGESLERLRAMEAGASEVSLALQDEARSWEDQADRFRKAGVSQALIDEWLALQETLADRRFLDDIRERGRQQGETDFQTSFRELREVQAEEIEQATLRGLTLTELAEIEAIHRAELEALIDLRDRELQQYTDLRDGITPWQRSLIDLDDAFSRYRQEQRQVIEAQEGLVDSAGTLAEAFAQLDAAQQATAESLYADLLTRLQSAGVEIPGFAKTILDLEFAMLRADLAAAATRDGFIEWLTQQGLTLDGLFAGIDAAYEQAVAGLDAPPPGVDRPGLGDGGRDTSEAETQRALDAVTEALLDLRDRDPRTTDPERIADLQLRYRQALDEALAGDTDAAFEAVRLSGELQELLGRSGSANGRYIALISQLDTDLSGLKGVLEDQLSDREIQEGQLEMLTQIRDRLSSSASGASGTGSSEGPTATGRSASDRPRITVTLPPFATGTGGPGPTATGYATTASGDRVEQLLGQAVGLLDTAVRQRDALRSDSDRHSTRLSRDLKGLAKPDPTLRRAAVEEVGGRGTWEEAP